MTVHFTLETITPLDEIGSPLDRGEVTAEDVLIALRSFDWAEDALRTVWAKKSTPGLAVTNHHNGSKLWVQGVNWLAEHWPGLTAPDDFGLVFIIGIFDAPKSPAIYSLKKQKELHECEFKSYDLGEVERIFALYLAEDYDAFFQKLFQLEVTNIVE